MKGISDVVLQSPGYVHGAAGEHVPSFHIRLTGSLEVVSQLKRVLRFDLGRELRDGHGI